MRRIFIVWGRETEHSRRLAQGLSAELRQIYYKKIGSYSLPAFFRYVFQAVETLLILFKEKPAVVIVQNPPVFAPLTAWLYCLAAGASLAIDSHTAAFLDKKWVNFHGLFKFVARRAIVNACHNHKNLEILLGWGVEPAIVMQPSNPKYDLEKLNQPLENKKLTEVLSASRLPIIMANRFASDDDWRTVIETAALMPEADFFVTGDLVQADLKAVKMPDNLILTGYLEHNEFLKLMSRAKVALAFTLRPDTVLWSVREAMALAKPFVTTDSEVLRRCFGEPGIFVKLKRPEELKEKILEAVRREEEIKEKIKIFLEKDKLRWSEEIEAFKNQLNRNAKK